MVSFFFAGNDCPVSDLVSRNAILKTGLDLTRWLLPQNSQYDIIENQLYSHLFLFVFLRKYN